MTIKLKKPSAQLNLLPHSVSLPPICWLLVVVEVVEIRSLKVNKHLVSKKKVVKKQKPKIPILAATSLLAVRPYSSSSLKVDNVDHKCINIQ